MTPFATWRSRLPASIGSWFSRDLVRVALSLVDAKRVNLRAVEDLKIESTVKDPRGLRDVSIEWGTGTGPLALRPVCTCGGSGICEHVVATLETVRSQTELEESAPALHEIDLGWLPSARVESKQARARSVWPVFTSPDGATLSASLVLDSPRLRGAVRDAQAIVAMMDATPHDDWDELDRELMRDEAVQEAFSGRNLQRALSRALFRLSRHPRLRFDDDPSASRHPSELAEFRIDLRGLSLRAMRRGTSFLPVFETVDGARVAAADAYLVDGPPTWVGTRRVAYLVDGSFDAKKAIEAARATNGAVPNGPLTPRTIARVAPFLTSEDRGALGISDAETPSADLALGWANGALVANVTFIDRTTGARAPYSALGAIAPQGERFVRFTAEQTAAIRTRLIDAGFVPRSADGFALHGTDRAAHFVREILPTWTDLERRLDPGLTDLVRGKTELDINVVAERSTENGDWFELKVDVFVGGSGEALTQKELAALLSSSGRFAEVRGKLVDVEKLRERNAILSDIAERRRSGLAALLALRDELHENFGNVQLPPEVEKMRERLRNFEGIPGVEAPPMLTGALRGYQQRGLDFLAYLAEFGFGGILADEMGLGKTLQVLNYLLRRKMIEGPAPSLVIAPTSVTHTWENEIARFAPELKVLRLHSGSERASRYEDVPNADVVITSYALARLDAQQLAGYHFRTLILDEAQNAKNPSSQIARVVRSLHADHRLALTGTPVENSLRDLWAIFAFVEPGLLGTETSFRRRFEIPIADNDEKAIATLRSRLEPFLLRRTKEDVAPELPERTEVSLACDLSPLQRRLYRGVAEAARRDVFAIVDQQGIESAQVHVLAALTRLRQICAHPGLLFEEHREEADASAKFEAFLETVDEILSGGHRLLVFSAFASMLRIMRTALDKRGIKYGYLDGSTKDKDRQDEVARFMAPDGPPLFLCSLKAGGVGLTLTAADYVILYDPWWNPAVERQAIDRTHRIGQQRAVTAYRLVTTGTVEEKIRALAERKSSLSRNIIKADGALAKALTREDLEMLFADPE
ncbi:MAG: DEAD/DEAH box helicase [Candidatus Eremiobacteraeota bacterium]|nr:DEAD/DEAH box helicase [Candidatus Eremiobacteraeota bacterium]